MGINIIRGGIGTGKSKMCIEKIKETHLHNPDDRCILLVPNHYSYWAEKSLVEIFGGTGLNGIEVLTLRKLANNMLSKETLNHITSSGRQMLIHKAIQDFLATEEKSLGALSVTIKKPGFCDVMSSLISEFKRYTVTPQMLMDRSEMVRDNDTLKNKLYAASKIYALYDEYIENSIYSDMEDDNIRVANEILKSDEFSSATHIWIDRFDEFTPQQMRVIDAIAKKGAEVTISVCFPTKNIQIYSNMKNTMNMLDDLICVYGLGEVYDTGNSFKSKKDKEIKFLLENWGRDDISYDEITENITISCARDLFEETEKIAYRILDLVREEKFRYRDIAILCGNTDDYIHIIETVFNEYNIPYFTDSKIMLCDHPIAMQVLSVFEIFKNDWNYESVFRYLKSGFIYKRYNTKTNKSFIKPINSFDVDYLENYVLKYGISGLRTWESEEDWSFGKSILELAFNRESENDKNTKADNLRREFIKPVLNLYKKVKTKNAAKAFAKSVFEFLLDINLYDGIKADVNTLKENGHINEAEQFTRLWNLLIDVLNQTVMALGDTKISFEEFGKYLEVGLSQCEIRTIPSGIDQVYVGNVEKCASQEVRAMFIMGANDGAFPSIISSEGFLSDSDRNLLSEEMDTIIAPSTKKKIEKQYFKVYKALCDVSERLYISRAVQNGDGKGLMPSSLIHEVKKLMPNIPEEKSKKDNSVYISTPKATIHKMLTSKRVNRENPLWMAVYDWYKGKDEWQELLRLTDRAKWFKKSDLKIDTEIADRLYENKTVYSASRLNTFSLCPFEYFIKYGLKLNEREIYTISPSDVGTYAHEIIKTFCMRVEDGAKTNEERLLKWRALTDSEREAMLDEIIDMTCENMAGLLRRDAKKTAAILKRTGSNIKNAARTIHRSLSMGRYTQHGMEKEFLLNINENITLKGIIDRVDMYTDTDETRVRIVDYKTGQTGFDIVNIRNGVDMQMALYAIAAVDMALKRYGKKAYLSGIYYNKVHNKLMDLALDTGEEEITKKRIAESRLDGVTFVNSDDELWYEDLRLKDKEASDFLNIAYKVNGELRKNDSIHSEKEAQGLLKFVEEKVVEIDKKIKDGEISCSPYKQGTNLACAYCSFSDACAFCDEKTPREKQGNAKTVWEELRGDTEETDDGGEE